MKIGKLLLSISFLYGVFIAFQMKQFVEYKKAKADTVLNVPFDIYIQIIITLVVGIRGAASSIDSFKPIRAYLTFENTKYDSLQQAVKAPTQFMLFNSRTDKKIK